MNTSACDVSLQPVQVDVPADILQVIIRFATLAKDPIDPHPLHLPHHRRHKYFEIMHDQDSLRTKCSMLLVCKQWKSWSTAFLYESLVVRAFTDVQLLSQLLRKIDETNTSQTLGRHVKRLHVISMYPLDASGSSMDPDVGWTTFATLIEAIPGLEVYVFRKAFSVSDTESTPPFVIETLARTCGQSLQAMIWPHNDNPPEVVDMLGLLLHTPNLRLLKCVPRWPWGDQSRDPAWYDLPQSSQVLLSLQGPSSLFCSPDYLDGDPSFPVKISSPLDHIFLTCDQSRVEETLERHGGSLIYAQIFGPVSVFQVPLDLERIVEVLAFHCPKINHIDLAFPQLAKNLRIPPSVEVVGLKTAIIRRPLETNYWENFLEGLVSMQGNSLKKVILLDPNHCRIFREERQDLVNALVTHFANSNIRLEDPNGQLLAA
ncbi:hypothetical protein BDN72DRAFT_849778 [Pluteus cervinus]|uniref:Uncharacterized protein n=1 Tax=Pluteus cervinus TaxID=181527 RepID=A0ACD3A6Y2_9AGAR|nr:hypothetical protein BDN72DRAFT_849778 [Pluteus cervinus]